MNKDICFTETDILLPQNTDMMKWSVIACDQYTSDVNYWDSVKNFVGSEMSALKIIFPEIYLEKETEEQNAGRINDIKKTMSEYEKKLKLYKDTMLFIERTQRNGRIRYGIVGAVDLEFYDYKKDSKSQIRATEETVSERLPPRIKIRRDATLESPHVMILYNDIEKKIISRLIKEKECFEVIYNFKLMENSGSIKAYKISPEIALFIKSELNELKNRSSENLLFAVGDGNHSLATAKECYEEIKKSSPAEISKNSPARYALAEIVNIYDDSLEFEPIYRSVFGTDIDTILSDMEKKFDISYNNETSKRFHRYEIIGLDKKITLFINNPKYKLPVKELQEYLDEYIKVHGLKIDYIHGRQDAERIAQSGEAVSFIFDTLHKNELFNAIEADGVMPRKTFSMGEAYDKRFYIECRKIR